MILANRALVFAAKWGDDEKRPVCVEVFVFEIDRCRRSFLLKIGLA